MPQYRKTNKQTNRQTKTNKKKTKKEKKKQKLEKNRNTSIPSRNSMSYRLHYSVCQVDINNNREITIRTLLMNVMSGNR